MRVGSVHHLHAVLLRAAQIAAVATLVLVVSAGYTVALALSDNPESSSNSSQQTNTTNLKVEGLGNEASSKSGSTLQGADGLQQSNKSSGGLQSPGSGLNSLQPNAGQSSF